MTYIRYITHHIHCLLASQRDILPGIATSDDDIGTVRERCGWFVVVAEAQTYACHFHSRSSSWGCTQGATAGKTNHYMDFCQVSICIHNVWAWEKMWSKECQESMNGKKNMLSASKTRIRLVIWISSGKAGLCQQAIVGLPWDLIHHLTWRPGYSEQALDTDEVTLVYLTSIDTNAKTCWQVPDQWARFSRPAAKWLILLMWFDSEPSAASS